MTHVPTIEDAVATYLNSVEAVTDLIGRTDGVYPDPAEQDAQYPFVTYYTQSGIEEQGLGGSHGVSHPRMTFKIWAEDKDQCVQLAKQVHDAFMANGGILGIVAGVDVRGMYFWGPDEGYDKEARKYWRSLDYEVWYMS